MQEYTVFNLAPFGINSYVVIRHDSPRIYCSTIFIQVPPFKDITGNSNWLVILNLLRNISSLCNHATTTQPVSRMVFNLAIITVNIASVKVFNLILFTIINIIQMVIIIMVIVCVLAIPIPVTVSYPMRASPFTSSVLTHSGLIVKAFVCWFILRAIVCIAGTNSHNGFQIISFTIINVSGFVLYSIKSFKPDMIVPIIVTPRETNHDIVAIFIVGFSENIPVHYCDDAFYSTGT